MVKFYFPGFKVLQLATRCILFHPFDNHLILMIADIFALRSKEKINAVLIKLSNFTTYHFECAVEEMILLGESLPQHCNRSRKSAFRKFTGVFSSNLILVNFRLN